MKVLIVAEELLIAMSLAAELELAGHQVLGPCASADEALRSLDGRHVDLALIDAALHAPLSGSELAKIGRASCRERVEVMEQAVHQLKEEQQHNQLGTDD